MKKVFLFTLLVLQITFYNFVYSQSIHDEGSIKSVITINNPVTFTEPPTGIGQSAADENTLLIFPNVTGDILTIRFPVTVATCNVSLISAEGKNIKQFKAASATAQIDINDLPAGIYFVRVETGSVVKAIRFIKA